MVVYEKNNKLNINFNNSIEEIPNIQLGENDSNKTDIEIDGKSLNDSLLTTDSLVETTSEMTAEQKAEAKANLGIIDATAGNIVGATAAMTPEQAAQTRQNIGADTPASVAAWLNEHVDPETGYVLDNSLTVEGAAADAKKVGDELGDLKSNFNNANIVNETTQTVVSANTFTNFPYKMKKGKTYLYHSLTNNNTMSFRTRYTEDGTNIDSFNAVATGSPLSFTASADANYIRVNSYIANGVFKIEEEGTIKYDLDSIMPVVPIVNLPPKLYAVSGLELNVYFDNIVENSGKYKYNITCSVGKQMERGYRFTPENTDAGTYTFQLDVLDDKENVVATKTSSLIVSASSAGSGASKTLILLGDSTVNGTDTQIVNDFTGDAMTITTLGTRGTSPALHEGRTGWMFQYYYNSATIGGISNPFYNPTSKRFDADYYFTNSNIAKPDYFFIQLGVNDVFTKYDDASLNTVINQMVTQCNYMISSILMSSPSTKVGIAVTIPPNYSQDAFGKAYDCGQTRNRYKRNNMLWVKKLLEEFSGKEAQGIYLVPICTNLDTIYNMGLESIAVNARNTNITYDSPIANGCVHPVESGYQQLADVYMAFIKAQM